MAIRFSTGLRDALLDEDDFKTTLADGVLYIYSGSQPASADSAESGTLLCIISESGGTFTPASATNGLEFGAAASGAIAKAAAEDWEGTVIAAGNAGWARFYDNNRTQGASTSSKRFDMSVGYGSYDLQIPYKELAVGQLVQISSFSITLDSGE